MVPRLLKAKLLPHMVHQASKQVQVQKLAIVTFEFTEYAVAISFLLILLRLAYLFQNNNCNSTNLLVILF